MKNYRDVLSGFYGFNVDDTWDEEMFHLLASLNKLGLRTKFHCIGHKKGDALYVMFDENLSDDLVLLLALLFSPNGNKGDNELYMPIEGFSLYKWARYNNGVLSLNWIMEIQYCDNSFLFKDRKKLAESMAVFLDKIV